MTPRSPHELLRGFTSPTSGRPFSEILNAPHTPPCSEFVSQDGRPSSPCAVAHAIAGPKPCDCAPRVKKPGPLCNLRSMGDWPCIKYRGHVGDCEPTRPSYGQPERNS